MKKLRLWASTLLATAGLYGQAYDIRISPPDHVGHRYLVSGKGASFQQLSSAGRVLKTEDYEVAFEGRAEILEVDGKGQAVRVAFTVGCFTKTEGGGATELLKPGSVILADGSLKDHRISLKDGEIGPEQVQAFNLIYSTHKPGDITDDEVFGAKEGKNVGESWPMNSKLASESLRDVGVEIPTDRLQGSAELVAKDKLGDADCLSVRADLKADSFAMKEPPPGLTLERGTLQGTFRGCFPLQGPLLSFRRGAELKFEMRLTSQEAAFDGSFKQSSEATWTNLER